MNVIIANQSHTLYAQEVCDLIKVSAQARGTGIAVRSLSYIKEKIITGHAVLALDGSQFVGFCYIESWDHQQYVVNSGLIVHPNYRNKGISKKIKHTVFLLSREKYPQAKLFSITTGIAVMKVNTSLGYRPVPFSEFTKDERFWEGCKTCRNYDILNRNNREMCLCTGMVYDPIEQRNTYQKNETKKPYQRIKTILNTLFNKQKTKNI